VDIDIIQRLLTLMDEGGLTELVYEKDDVKVKLSRRQEHSGTMMMPAQAPMMAHAAPMASPAAAPVAEAAVVEEGILFRSPMVGTFYSRPNPESDIFVSKGDSVSPETVLCIIEAMKVFNDIQAEISGQILEALVKDGDTVQFDQPLFRIQPS
jgi:acetyl-CoA carboxylase biotin carboxyl carrier protein